MPEKDLSQEDLLEQTRQCMNEGIVHLHRALNEFLAICYDKYDFRAAITATVGALEYLLSENKEFIDRLVASKDFDDLKTQYGLSDTQLSAGQLHLEATRIRMAAKVN